MSGRKNSQMMRTMIKKHGSEKAARQWWASIAAIGGSRGAKDGTIKGFALATPEQRQAWGRLGGARSRKPAKRPENYTEVF